MTDRTEFRDRAKRLADPLYTPSEQIEMIVWSAVTPSELETTEVLSGPTRFFVELIMIGNLLITGYDLIGRPGNLDTSALEGVLATMNKVNKRIEEVGKKIGELFHAIDALEASLKGYITQELIEVSNGKIVSIADDLSGILKTPESVMANVKRLESRTDALKDELEVIRRLSRGGYSGCCLMTPGIALWIHAHTTLNRAKTTGISDNVWDHPFHARNIEMFRQMFDANDRLTARYEEAMKEMPKPRVVYRYVSESAVPSKPERFEATGQPFKTFYPPGEGNENMFCYTQGNFGFGLHRVLYIPQLNSHPPGWSWVFLWGSGSRVKPVHEAALRVDRRLTALRWEIAHHRDMMRGSASMRPLIESYCATKPAEWGGTGEQPATALVHLHNTDWPTVQVEVRRGKEGDCGLNAAFETKQLALAELWTIPAPGVDVCYRRDRDPEHPDGQWTEWRRVVVTGDGEYYEPIG
jgi:hypothetical protein